MSRVRSLLRPTLFVSSVTATTFGASVLYDIRRNVTDFSADTYQPEPKWPAWDDFNGYLTLRSLFASFGTSEKHANIQDKLRKPRLLSQIEESRIPVVLQDLLCIGVERWFEASQAQRLTYSIVGVNALVFCGWQLPGMSSVMMRYFLDQVGSRLFSLIGASWSHQSLLHFGFNMVCLASFIPPLYQQMQEHHQKDYVQGASLVNGTTLELVSFIVSGGIYSTFASRVFRTLMGRTSGSLGASGAIYSLITYRALTSTQQDQLSLIFLPGFSFPMFEGFQCFLAMDLILLFRSIILRNSVATGIDHAGHLGGALFGYMYLRYDREGNFLGDGGRVWQDLSRHVYFIAKKASDLV